VSRLGEFQDSASTACAEVNKGMLDSGRTSSSLGRGPLTVRTSTPGYLKGTKMPSRSCCQVIWLICTHRAQQGNEGHLTSCLRQTAFAVLQGSGTLF